MLGVALLAGCANTVRVAPPVVVAPPPPVVAAPPPAAATPNAPSNRIAILVPMSGGNGAVGRALSNAANLALADLREGGATLSLRTYDTAALGASAAAERAIGEGATLILGPLLAGDVSAVRPVAAARQVPVLAFSNDAGVAGGNVWVLGYQPGQAVSRVVAYARGRGVSRFAGLMPAGAYGQRASVAFTRAVQSSGGQVVALTTFQRDAKRLVAAARTVTAYDARLKRAGAALTRPDGTVAPVQSGIGPVAFGGLMIADSGQVAAAFTGPLAQFGARPGAVLLMGTELWNNEPGLARVPGMRGAVFAAVPDGRFQALAARYRARFGAQPSRLASLAYDAVLLAASARDRWPVGAAFPQGVLGDPQGFAGIDGIFRFRGNVAERGLEVQRVDGGGFVTVSPAPSSF